LLQNAEDSSATPGPRVEMREISEKKMECRLTIGMALFFLVGIAYGDPGDRSLDGRSAGGDATILSVHWEGVSFREAISKLQSNSKTAVFVDRRVDPTEPVDLTIENVSVDEILERLAATRPLGVTQVDTLVYLGPARDADALSAIAPLRREDISRLGPQDQRSLVQRGAVSWPRLTEPRELVIRFLQDRGWRVTGSQQIPYDLWPAGQLPKMTVADALSVLLIGFDLTYRPLARQQTIEIVPISASEWAKRPVSKASGQTTSSPQVAKKTTQRYTLRVEEQPVGKVLSQLSQQLHLEVKVDEPAIQIAGLSMNRRISFEVRDADLDGLLSAALTPAGLTFTRDGAQLRIVPR
jgi:hypothetical protein